MKKVFIILGLISAIIATILSSTQLFNLSIAPIIIAFLSGLILIFISKKENSKTKTIQYIFLLVIISLSLTIYKGVFSITKEGDTVQPEVRDEKSVENPKKNPEAIKIDKGI